MYIYILLRRNVYIFFVVHHMGSSRPVFLEVEVGFHLKKAKIEIGIGKFHDISTSFANKKRHYFLLGGCSKKLHLDGGNMMKDHAS